jgi:hypothetical protein
MKTMATRLSKDRNFRIKWAGPNEAVVEIGAQYDIVNTVDLIRMHRELTEFIRFYGLAAHAEVDDDD